MFLFTLWCGSSSSALEPKPQSSTLITENVTINLGPSLFDCSPSQDLNVPGVHFCIAFFILTKISAALCTGAREKQLWQLPGSTHLRHQADSLCKSIGATQASAGHYGPEDFRGVSGRVSEGKTAPTTWLQKGRQRWEHYRVNASPPHFHCLLNPLGLLKEYMIYRS